MSHFLEKWPSYEKLVDQDDVLLHELFMIHAAKDDENDHKTFAQWIFQIFHSNAWFVIIKFFGNKKLLSARLEFQVQYSSELRSIRVLLKSIILKYNYIPSESHYVILNSRYKRNWILFQSLAMLHSKPIQVKTVIIE